MRALNLVALGLMLMAPAYASEVHIRCVEGPYQTKPFSFVIDDDAKGVSVPGSPVLSPAPDDIDKFDGKTVSWGFMRGSVTFHRDTDTLEWDATAEYDYLDYIGETPEQSRESYAGHSKCTVENSGRE